VDEKPGRRTTTWLKLVFEMSVQSADNVVLDPTEHQKFLFASEEEVHVLEPLLLNKPTFYFYAGC
jgi:hypothetical protein